MHKSFFSAPLDVPLRSGFKLVPNYRFVDIRSFTEIFALDVGDGYQIKELPFPAEPPFTIFVKKIAKSGFRGRIIFAPIQKNTHTIMFVRPSNDATDFYQASGLPPSHPDDMFSFMASKIDIASRRSGNENDLLDELLNTVKIRRQTIIVSAYIVHRREADSVDAWSIAPGPRHQVTQRPYILYSIVNVLKSCYGSIPTNTILVVTQRKDKNEVFCFTSPESRVNVVKRLLTPDELFFTMSVQIRQGPAQLDLKRLATQLTKHTPFKVLVSEYQVLTFSRICSNPENIDAEELRVHWRDALLDALLVAVMDIGVGFAELFPAQMRASKIGFLGDYMTSNGFVHSPSLSSHGIEYLRELGNGGMPLVARSLLLGANGSIVAFSPRDSLLSACAAVEESFFDDSQQKQLLGAIERTTIETVLNTLKHLSGPDRERLMSIIGQVKNPTKNDIISANAALMTNMNEQEVKAIVKGSWKVRGKLAHKFNDKSQNSFDISAANLRKLLTVAASQYIQQNM